MSSSARSVFSSTVVAFPAAAAKAALGSPPALALAPNSSLGLRFCGEGVFRCLLGLELERRPGGEEAAGSATPSELLRRCQGKTIVRGWTPRESCFVLQPSPPKLEANQRT